MRNTKGDNSVKEWHKATKKYGLNITCTNDLCPAIMGDKSVPHVDCTVLCSRSAELLVINYHGRLKSYYVSRDKGYKSRHSFVFSGHYPLGISSVVYLSKHKMLLVGGCGQGGEPSSAATEAISEGITAWRLLSDMPHYKLVTDYDTGMTQVGTVGVSDVEMA